jgi:hypothetical protein
MEVTEIILAQVSRLFQLSQDSRLLPNVCDVQKENLTLGYGFKNLIKSI